MRNRMIAAAFAVMGLISLAACSAGVLGKQYEYEEDLTLDIDGSATLVVNASLASLAVLRGLDVPTDPAARINRDEIRALFESPVTDVRRVSRPWQRKGRRFVQVRIAVPDVRTLHDAAPFAWSRYEFTLQDGRYVYRQHVGASALKRGTLQNYGWDGSELVAFRLHLPSRITFHNSRDVDTNQPAPIQRGNILAWEQHLADRLDGQPVDLQVEMESASILHQTLWLFAGAFAAAVLLLVGLIWWTMQRGKGQEELVSGGKR